MARRFQYSVSANHVGLDKGHRAVDRAIDVAFRRQVHHHVRLILGKYPIQLGAIADVDLLESIALALSHHRQRLEVTGIGQLIHHHHAIAGGLNDVPHDCGANETGTTGN